MRGIGIDFGTTNSVIALADDAGNVHAMNWPTGHDTTSDTTSNFRTALAFRSIRENGQLEAQVAAGPEAIAWALDPTDNQRFVQSIKTHLGSAAFRETRVFGKSYSLESLIALFLRHLTEKGLFLNDLKFDPCLRVAAGRPVVFAGERPDEDLAVKRLTKAYANAGIASPDFVYEPIGAAYWYARDLQKPQTVLVADFGGGTSDFSVMQFDRQNGVLKANSLAHDGVGIAGDTFDYRIIDAVIAPKLGKNARYRSFQKWLPVPQHFFAAFSRWHQLSWLKSMKVLNDLDDIRDNSDEPEKLDDLRTMIDHDLGLDLYAAITQAKAELSYRDSTEFVFDRAGVALSTRLNRKDFEGWIKSDLEDISSAMDRALSSAKTKDSEIDAVFMTGGTSHVPAVRKLFTDRFGDQRIHTGNAFQSVASGLALVARDRAMADQ
jgi:hypothetical chaperone protein